MRIKAAIKVKQDYECHKCGRIEEGTQKIFDTDVQSSLQMLLQLIVVAVNERRAHDMPVGWSSNYKLEGRAARTVFHCNHCTIRSI